MKIWKRARPFTSSHISRLPLSPASNAHPGQKLHIPAGERETQYSLLHVHPITSSLQPGGRAGQSPTKNESGCRAQAFRSSRWM
jgi:hypothetical protein